MSEVQMFYAMLALVAVAMVVLVYEVRKHRNAVQDAATTAKYAAIDAHNAAVSVGDKVTLATKASVDVVSVAAATAANAVKKDVTDKLATVSSDVATMRTTVAAHFEAMHETGDKIAASVDALHARVNESHAALSAKLDTPKPAVIAHAADKHDEPSKAAETAAK